MRKKPTFNCIPWIISLTLLLTITACGGIEPVPNTTSDYWETENNDNSSQADVMSVSYSPGSDGYDYTGFIAPEDGSDDWYRLTTAQSGQLSVTLTRMDLAYAGPIYITLYNSGLTELDSGTLGGSSGESVTANTAAGASAGTFYVRIDADSLTHRYDLTPSFSGGSTSSDYWERESNDNSSQSDVMPLDYWPGSDGYDYTGIITSDDRSDDWYRFTLTQSGQLAVTLNCLDLGTNEHLYITLYNSALNELDARTLSGSTGESATAYTAAAASAGTYYVRIDADSWPHRYDLTPSFTGGGGVADAWELESNNSSSQADQMSLNYSPGSDGYGSTGVISSDDTSADWYRLTTTQYGLLTVTLNSTDLAFGERIYITLYSSGLGEIDQQSIGAASGGSATVWSADYTAPGDYYVRIDADSWPHRYDLSPQFTP